MTDIVTPFEERERVGPTAKAADPKEYLYSRRAELKEELKDLNDKIGEGSTHRVWLRSLPNWTWYPVHIVYKGLGKLMPVRVSHGRPDLATWARHADATTFAANIFIGFILLNVAAGVLLFIV